MKCRRTILKLPILLAAGAASSIAVAWGCVWGTMTVFEASFERDDFKSVGFRHHRFAVDRHPDDVERAISLLENPILQGSRQPNPTYVMFPVRRHVTHIDAGWPCMSLRGRQFEGKFHFIAVPNWPGAQLSSIKMTREGITLTEAGATASAMAITRDQLLEIRLLPLLPIWPGFAINTVFYAGVLWVLCCGPFALRRMIRRRRGQCAHCAYPIGQNQRCTECGAAVT